ncbi:unnamed protein product [Mytilus coruscus]|uniref:Reverse transcriptase domain-containing protein n=1 Tax=Mytilus coruscus TaxID=42192 RepID=A0A6J8CSE9_MYTCO|nr:unnamed protein product [Mytilus coruscus]
MSFKNGKAADEQGSTIEHLKYGGQPIVKIIVKLVNFIFQHINLPSDLKSGICYPVFKNGGKPRDVPNWYRKITVTNTIGKVVEKLHLSKNVNIIKDKQSRLRKGFTEGECPSVAALILTELKAEAKKLKKQLIITLSDAQKAFDIVWHAGLMREMYKGGMTGDNWLLINE